MDKYKTGVSIEDLGATIAGVPTSNALTGIKAAISNIINPSKEAIDKAKELGIKFNAGAFASNKRHNDN